MMTIDELADLIVIQRRAVASLHRALDRAQARNSPTVPSLKEEKAKAERSLKKLEEQAARWA